jgi:5-methylcytosine-specific restriction endonuclease McrA
MTTYWVPDETMPHSYNTSKGKSKNEEWMQVLGVPCVKVNESKFITLQSFTSAENRMFDVNQAYFEEHFKEITPDNLGNLNLERYPIPINIKEFKLREELSELVSKIKSLFKNENISESIKKIIEDKLDQIVASQGCTSTATLDIYYKYKLNILSLSVHKRIGDPVFNRSVRWMPPVEIEYEEFSKTKSFPAPIGIRLKDFCLPSELIHTLSELITQLINFDNVSEKDFTEIKKSLNFIEKKKCCCKYCGKTIDINGYSSKYKSSNNFIEICHRDPNGRFLPENMYWGHGECNRRQGGYSEKERMEDALLLMLINCKLTEEEYNTFKVRL